MKTVSACPKYNPDALLDTVIKLLELKNDAQLSRILEMSPTTISKIRHQKAPVGASLLVRMHEVTNLEISELRALMGDQRAGLFSPFVLDGVVAKSTVPRRSEN